MEKVVVDSIEKNSNMAKVTLSGVPDRPGVAGEIFGALGQEGISVELLVTSPAKAGRSNISFAMLESNMAAAKSVLEKIKGLVGTDRMTFQPKMALISIHGQQLAGVPGVAGKMFHALASNGINIDSISSSRTTVTCLISQEKIEQADASLQAVFQLGRP